MKLWSIAALPFKVTSLHQEQNSHHLLTQQILLQHDSQVNRSAQTKQLIIVSISQWVKVLYEGEVFLGKVLNKQNNIVLVQGLSKPFAITEPQDLERENYVH